MEAFCPSHTLPEASRVCLSSLRCRFPKSNMRERNKMSLQTYTHTHSLSLSILTVKTAYSAQAVCQNYETKQNETIHQGVDFGYRRGNIFFAYREHMNAPIKNHHCPSLIYLSVEKYHMSYLYSHVVVQLDKSRGGNAVH